MTAYSRGWLLRYQRQPDFSPVEVPFYGASAEANAKKHYDWVVEELRRDWPLSWAELRIDGTVAYRFDARQQEVAHV